MTDALVVAGEVPKEDVPSFFAAADLVAHDLNGGGCGTASLEAMAAGRATISTVRETNFPGVAAAQLGELPVRQAERPGRPGPGDHPAARRPAGARHDRQAAA